MTVSIVTCPGCGSLLLSDTAECPQCHHIFDAKRAEALSAASTHQSEYTDAGDAEDPCPECGEMVRRGLVRCFSCGTFMRKDIARHYQRMRSSDSPIIYSPVSDFKAAGRRGTHAAREEEVATGDEDFELAPEFAMTPAQVESAQQAAEAGEPPATYALKRGDQKTPPAADADQTPAAETPPAAKREAPPETGEAHSVATGGDALLNIALQEEQESTTRKKRGGRRRPSGTPSPGSVLVHCICGARIRVQDKHRGMLGHCPKCDTAFIVPPKSAREQQQQTQAAPEAASAPADAAQAQAAAGKFARWMTDVSVHTVNPQKLRLKPGSLKGDFQEMDLGFSSAGLLLVTLTKKGGSLFGGGDKKKEPAREAVLTHLREGRSHDDVPAPAKRFFDASAMQMVAVVQPAPYVHESMFGGVPVFGEGRIAVRLPKTDTTPELLFASFFLSGFREFSAAMKESFGIDNLGAEQGVPLDDEINELTCHYSEAKLQVIEHVEYYQADPKYKVALVGRRCSGCGLIVSEDSRKKEKIGGSSGRGIAKAKCPKCGQPFGDNPLYALEQPAGQPAEQPAAPTA